MGRKVHPIGFRIGIIRDWQAKWYASKHKYVEFLHQDLKLRQVITSKYADAGVSLVEIDRQANRVVVAIHTARPGVVIGRGGQRVEELRQRLESLIGNKVQLNIQEIRQPELDAYLVAKSVAEQIERRVAHRRAMKQAMFRTLAAGAKGIRISCAGRLGGSEIARRETMHQGQVPLQKLRADIDYGLAEAHTTLGRIGVKVWIYKGDILPQVKVEEVEEVPTGAAEGLAEPVAEESVEAELSPPVELAEKTPEPEPVKPASVELEEKPAKPTRRVKKVKDIDSASVKLEEKPAKPTRRVKKVKDIDSASVKLEEQDATTQTSEIPQES